MRRAANKNGFGLILAITMLFLITWGVTGLAQMTFSGAVTENVQTATTGAMAVACAETAIEEAFHQVSLRVNQSGDPLWTELREEYVSKAKSYKTFSVTPNLTLQTLAADPLYRGFELADGAVEVKVLGERPLTNLTYESRGTLQFSARFSQGSVARTVRQTRGFKVALVSTPRPFDQVTWLLRHPEALYGTRGVANANLDWARNGAEELLAERTGRTNDIADVLQKVNDEVVRDEATRVELNDLAVKAGYSQLQITAVPKLWPPEESHAPVLDAQLATPPAGLLTEDVAQEYHKFPADLVLYSVKDTLPQLSKSHYLSPQVADRKGEIARAEKRHAAAVRSYLEVRARTSRKLSDVIAWRQDVTGNPPAPGDLAGARRRQSEATAHINDNNDLRAEFGAAANEYATATAALSAAYQSLWESYRQITTLQGPFLKLSGSRTREIAGYDTKFDVSSSPLSGAGRAFLRFTGPKASARFLQFLADQPAGRPLNGVVFVDNGGETLRLKGLKLHGKLDLAVSGPVDLEDVSLASPTDDLFTVHAQSRQPVRISGRVTASILAAGPVELSEGALLIGNLVQFGLQSPDGLNGTIQHDKRYFSGFAVADQKLDHLVVALSPIPSTTSIARR